MKKHFYELRVSMYLLDDIKKEYMYDRLSNMINFSFNNSQVLSCLHKSKGFKYYCFSGLYPIEKDGVYKQDEIYQFMIRFQNDEYLKEFVECLTNLKNNDFVVTSIEQKKYNYRNISYIDTITPCIVTLKDGLRWSNRNNSPQEFKQAIYSNLINKYNKLYDTNFSFKLEDIIEEVVIKSHCGINTFYKNTNIVGYKLRVKFKNNNVAQDIANMSVFTGVGEKNSSIGMGFTKPYFRKED